MMEKHIQSRGLGDFLQHWALPSVNLERPSDTFAGAYQTEESFWHCMYIL